MLEILLRVICVAAVIIQTRSHTYHSGRCPEVEPFGGFQMDKFLGLWYAIEKTSTFSSCLTYNFQKSDGGRGEFTVQQESQNAILKGMPFKHIYRYTGRISQLTTDAPALMKVNFPLNLMGDAFFTVFSTDYVHFAGVFTCQNLGFMHRLSVTILSRDSHLDGMEVQRMHSFLRKYKVDISDLNVIQHSTCPKRDAETFVIDIDHDFFDNIFNGDSQEDVVALAVPERDIESREENSEQTGLNSDAEWINL